MLFTGVLDAAYAVHAVLSLTAVDNITGDSLVLGGASDITTFESGGHTYAVVASYSDYGVQILNITNPANITAASSIPYDPNLELRGAYGITTFESGVHTYAAVAAEFSDGVQILNITDPLRIAPASSITDDSTNTDDLELNGARGITTFVSGGHTYVAVAAYRDDGVQILNVTDPPNITPAGRITDDGTNTDDLELNGAQGITTFESGGHTYVAVAAYDDDGVQILNVTDPPNITPAGRITDDGTNTDDLELNGARGITTFVSGGHTYVAVAAYHDDGVQILNVTDPPNITPAGSIDINTLKINGAQDITTFESGGHTYVAVAAYDDNGVQILDVTDPPNITPAGNIIETDTNTDDLVLDGARGITTFESGGHTYAAVAAYFDSGVQIIRIDITESDTTPPSISGAVAASLNSITVTFSENADADATNGLHWSLDGTDAGSLTVSANTDPTGSSNSMTLTLSGDLPDTRPDLTLIYTKPNTGGITDGNNQLEGATVTVEDGIAPTVTGTRATSGTVLAMTISEDVSDNSATPGDFSLSGVASSPTVSSISVSGITVTLTLSSTIVTSDSPLLSYSRTSGFVQDVSTNPLADFSSVAVDTSADITPPSISGAVAASLNSITVTFSENADADATNGLHWSLDGTDAGSLTVSANTDPAGSSNSMTLTLSGDLPDTRPDLTLIYTKPNTGGITDGNNQLEGATVTVEDGIAPTVTGTRATSGTVLAMTISEDVSDNSATPGDFSLSGVASSPTVSSISVSGITVTLTLSSTIVTSDSPLLSYSRTSGFVQDVSTNPLADFSSVAVDTSADITPPSISGAVAASLNSITVTFSENADADATNGLHWSLDGTDAGSLTVSANTDPARTVSVMTLTLSGDLPDTRPDLTLIYTKPNTGGITDGNNQLEGATVTVEDGIAPTVTGTRATSGTVLAMTISEDVSDNSATPGDFSLSGVASSPTVSSISVSGITVTLTLSSTIVTSDSPLLSYSRTSGFVQDVSTNPLADFSSVAVDTSADITPPSISGAVAASLNSITVTFSENADADATNGLHWSLDGTDAGSLTVSANTDPARTVSVMTLTLSGDLPDTRPDLTLIYTKPNTGGITDGNNQLEGATVTVEDGIAPTVTGTRATSGTVLAMTISEDVSDNSATPGDFSLSGVASSPTVSSISVSGITVTLTLSSTIVTSDSPLLSYSRTSGFVQDVSTNPLADFSSVAVDTSADITPPVISKAVATSPNSITVTFDENVDVDVSNGSNWSLGGTDAGSLTVTANTDPARTVSVMTLTLSGDLPDTRPDLTLIYTKPNTGGITDGNNQLEGATVTVEDGIAPTVTGTRATSGTVIALTISEDVSDNSATPGDFSLSGVASSPTVSSISVSGITVTLTLSSTIVTSDSPLLSYSRTSGFVQDVSTNPLADFSSVAVDTSADITPPVISKAVATSPNSITVTFDENVDVDVSNGSNWSLGGTDAGSLTVTANTDPARTVSVMTLTLSGDLPDTRPDLTLIYTKPNTGGITDGNNQLEGATVTVEDGIAPTVTGTRATSGTVIALTISEDVSDNSATPGDFSLSGVASSPTVSSISVSGITVTLTLSSTIVTSDSPLLSYSRTSGFVQDVSTNPLADFSSVAVDTSADITPPVISKAVATSPNSITVTFDENVDVDVSNGSNWSLGGTDAGSLTVTANTDPARTVSVMTLTLSGDLPDTRPDLTLIYTKPNTGGITDGNNQLEGATVTVEDGIAPTVTGTRATSGTVLAMTISEDVSDNSATPGDFSLSGVASSPTVSSISVSGITVTLTLSSTIVTSDSPLLSYSRTSGFVQDVSTNPLADFSSVAVDTSADITPPVISKAVATSPNSITVTFDENVDVDVSNGSNWSLGGTDAGSLTVTANTDPARTVSVMTLTLSGDLPDTRPDLTLIYTKPNTGGITDGNNQLEGATVTVEDGIAPTVTGTRATSGTVLAMTISEDVSDNSATPGDFSLSGVASSPTVSSISVSGITVTLTLSSTIVTSDSPLLSYSRTSGFVQDVSTNPLADFSSVAVDTSADITPPVISKAVATSPNSITVTFDENVDVDVSNGSNWSLGGTDAGSLTVTANTDPARTVSVMTLTLSGDLPDTRPDLTLIYTKPNTGGITDGNNQLEGATVTVEDGIAPTVTGTRATSGTVIALTISEDVSDNSATPGDFSLSGVASSPTVSSISVSGITVTLTLSSTIVTSDSPLLSYSRTSGFVQDVSTNPLADFSSVAVDTSADITAPTVTSLTASEQSPTNSTNAVFTVTFSEDVTFAGDILVTGGTASPARPTGTASSFTFTVTPDGDGEVTVQTPASSANDNVGNGNLASDIASLTFDRTEPVITPPGSIRLELGDRYVQPAAACSDVIDRNPTVTVTVDDVDVNQVGVYTLMYTCTDDAGNLATDTSTVTVFDPSGFATSITSDPASPTSSPSVEFTVTFEEALGANEVLTEDEIHVSPESPILNLAVSGIDSNVYTFRLGNLNGTYQVSVQNGAVNNALGTPNALAGIRVVVDRTDPAIMPPIGTVIQIGHLYHDATCTDNLDGNPVLTAIGAVDTGLEGTYPVTYRCTDALGNSSILDVVFTVINDPPEFRSASPLSGIYAHDTGNSTRVDIQGTTSPDTHSSTVTITLGDEVFEQIVKMDAPQIDIDAMAFSDEYGKVMAEPVSNLALRLTSPSRGGGEHPPIIDLGTLAYQRLADIPPHIAEQAASHDASEPLEPITPDDTFDLPLVIDGYGYLLDDTTNTLVPQTVRAGDNSTTHITFTVYTQKDLAHFILYLNLQGENTDYADSDTYITYEGDGTTVVTDPHGYIAGATITVTHEDDQVPEKKTVRIIVEFAEPMGPTNMVAYLWNTDRKAVFIRVIDALDVVAAPPQEPEMQAADPEPVPLDGQMPADPEPVPLDGQMPADPEPVPLDGQMPADPEPISSDILWFDDYDEAQVLHIIRMWSGFESEFITDTQLLGLLGLEDYQDVDLPDWMMTQLGVLVAKGDVTVGEFVLALQYVLTHA